MEEKNVVFEVTKVGFSVNSKWNVFVDNEFIGKIDFKQNLTKKLSKGKHIVQYKVGVQKTKVLEFIVADEDIIIECIWDGTVKNFHVVGGEYNNTTNNIPEINNTKSNIQIETSNATPTQTSNNANSNTEVIFKILGAVILIIIIIVGFWHIYGGNGVDGEYWFSDGSGYVKINKDINRIYFYDEYNSAKGTTSVKFTDNKTFVYSDGLLEYTGTVNGNKLTVKCENDKMGGFEAIKK